MWESTSVRFISPSAARIFLISSRRDKLTELCVLLCTVPLLTMTEEVYEDTRDKQGRTKEPKTLQISKAKKATKFDDLTFSHAQKIFENIQMFKYAYVIMIDKKNY